MAKKKRKISTPVKIEAMTFDQVLMSAVNQKPVKRTATENKKLNDILKEIAASQGPGDSFLMFSITPKKK